MDHIKKIKAIQKEFDIGLLNLIKENSVKVINEIEITTNTNKNVSIIKDLIINGLKNRYVFVLNNEQAENITLKDLEGDTEALIGSDIWMCFHVTVSEENKEKIVFPRCKFINALSRLGMICYHMIQEDKDYIMVKVNVL